MLPLLRALALLRVNHYCISSLRLLSLLLSYSLIMSILRCYCC